jgi:predicted outer membrane lipoprotein
MVTLKILDEEFDETIENIPLSCAFTMIEGYCFEHMIDEPKVSDMTNIGNALVLHGDDVTFEIEDYHG